MLVLKIGTVLAQIQELRCMQKHINKGGRNGSNCSRMVCIISCWLYYLGFRLNQYSNKF